MNFFIKIKKIIPASLHIKFVFLLMAILFSIALELIGIGLVLPVVSIIAEGKVNFNIGFGIEENINNYLNILSERQVFIYPLLFLIGAYGVKTIYFLFLSYFNAKFMYLLNINLSETIFKNYLFQDYLFHLRKNSTDLVRTIVGEINFFLKSFLTPLINIITEAIVLLAIITLLLIIETNSTIILIFIFTFFGSIYFLFINKKITQWGIERINNEDMKQKHVVQGLNGIKVVKIFNRENIFLEYFNINSFRSAKVGQYVAIFNQIPRIAIEFIAILLIVLFIIINVQTTSNLIESFPTIALFAAAGFRLLPSINRLFSNYHMFRYANPAVNRIYDAIILNKGLNYKESNNLNFDKEINIKNLSFKYPEKKENIFENINLTIKSGESIGFVGKTGSGKSTLIDIICGLLEPQKGEVLVDNKNINNNFRSWKDFIGYVPQNVYLLDDTIGNNIIFGKKHDSNDDPTLKNSIKSAQLEKFISKLPDGLDTVVGERGARLSGGQIQRIGIARALNNNAKLIIFDESTSALDSKTEQEFINDINQLKIKKTLIIISHRMSVLENCDRIYEIKDKKIFLKK